MSASQAHLLNLIFRHTLDSVVVLDGDFNFVRVSESYARACQRDSSDLVGRNHFDLYPSSLQEEFEAARRDRRPRSWSARPFTFPDHPEWGETYWDLGLVPIPDAAGGVELFLFTLRDVTAEVRAQQTLRASELHLQARLREKETLLREVHHRVKNNLQIISSLIHFQSKKARSPEDRMALSDLRERLMAMTLVHDKLYQSRDLALVELGDYVRSLVGSLRGSLGARSDVTLDVVSDAVRLPLDVALPVGMIVCELVTNVFKYAFPAGRAGTATVSVRAADALVTLTADDDGVGFPEGFDPRTGGSFGWALIRSLVEQIGGDLEASTSAGAHVRISFESPASSRARAGSP